MLKKDEMFIQKSSSVNFQFNATCQRMMGFTSRSVNCYSNAVVKIKDHSVTWC